MGAEADHTTDGAAGEAVAAEGGGDDGPPRAPARPLKRNKSGRGKRPAWDWSVSISARWAAGGWGGWVRGVHALVCLGLTAQPTPTAPGRRPWPQCCPETPPRCCSLACILYVLRLFSLSGETLRPLMLFITGAIFGVVFVIISVVRCTAPRPRGGGGGVRACGGPHPTPSHLIPLPSCIYVVFVSPPPLHGCA